MSGKIKGKEPVFFYLFCKFYSTINRRHLSWEGKDHSFLVCVKAEGKQSLDCTVTDTQNEHYITSEIKWQQEMYTTLFLGRGSLD